MHKVFACGCVMLFAGSCFAETISLNFTGIDSAHALGNSDLAGLVGNEAGNTLGSTMVGNWNNLNGNSNNVANLTSSSGTVVGGVTVSWSADNVWDLPNTTNGANTSANTTMMRGYLDNASESTTSITVSGLQVSGTYSVIVYIDGNNTTNWTRGTYKIGGTSVLNEDSESTDFNSGSGNNANGLFQIPVDGGVGNQVWPVDSANNSEGNMIIFTGLTGSSFTLTATPGSASDMSTQRAAINGIQIVGVIPEPVSASLLSLIAAAAWFIRRRLSI